MSASMLIGSLGLELLRRLNKPELEKWVKEILKLKNEERIEQRKPSIEERGKYPELKDKDFRNNGRIDDINSRLYDLGQAIVAASRA